MPPACGGASLFHVVKATALVEEFRLRRVKVFRLILRVHRATAKSNRPTPCVADRKHDPAPESVIGFAPLGRRLGQPRTKDQLIRYAFGLQRIPQPLPTVWRKADFPMRLRLFREAALGQIIPRRPRRAGAQLQAEPLHRLLHHLGQLRAFVGLGLGARVLFGHRHADFAGDDLNCLDKAHILGLAHERDRIPLRVAAKAVVEPFTVIDVKAGGFFLMERAWRPHVALALIGLSVVPYDLAPHHLRQAGAVTQFFQKSRGQAHGFIYRLGRIRVQRRQVSHGRQSAL